MNPSTTGGTFPQCTHEWSDPVPAYFEVANPEKLKKYDIFISCKKCGEIRKYIKEYHY